MRVVTVSSAAMAGLLLATFGLSACSSSSTADATSDAAVTASAGTDGAASAAATGSTAPDTSGDPVGTTAACAEINVITADYMTGLTTEDPENWQLFSDALLTLSDSADTPEGTQALMSLAVAASFTVTGLQSGEPLETAKGDFDTAFADMNTVCTASGTPLT